MSGWSTFVLGFKVYGVVVLVHDRLLFCYLQTSIINLIDLRVRRRCRIVEYKYNLVVYESAKKPARKTMFLP